MAHASKLPASVPASCCGLLSPRSASLPPAVKDASCAPAPTKVSTGFENSPSPWFLLPKILDSYLGDFSYLLSDLVSLTGRMGDQEWGSPPLQL